MFNNFSYYHCITTIDTAIVSNRVLYLSNFNGQVERHDYALVLVDLFLSLIC